MIFWSTPVSKIRELKFTSLCGHFVWSWLKMSLLGMKSLMAYVLKWQFGLDHFIIPQTTVVWESFSIYVQVLWWQKCIEVHIKDYVYFMYSKVQNECTCTFINIWNFFPLEFPFYGRYVYWNSDFLKFKSYNFCDSSPAPG